MSGQKIQILLEMDEEGNMSFKGPVANKHLCYGMLQIARDIVKDFKPSPIAVAQAGDIPSASKLRLQ